MFCLFLAWCVIELPLHDATTIDRFNLIYLLDNLINDIHWIQTLTNNSSRRDRLLRNHDPWKIVLHQFYRSVIRMRKKNKKNNRESRIRWNRFDWSHKRKLWISNALVSVHPFELQLTRVISVLYPTESTRRTKFTIPIPVPCALATLTKSKRKRAVGGYATRTKPPLTINLGEATLGQDHIAYRYIIRIPLTLHTPNIPQGIVWPLGPHKLSPFLYFVSSARSKTKNQRTLIINKTVQQ